MPLLLILAALSNAGDRCTYTFSVWDTRAGRTVEAAPVDKPRSELGPHEQGPLGCTPCTEDQRSITLSNGLSLEVCHAVADRVRTALEKSEAKRS